MPTAHFCSSSNTPAIPRAFLTPNTAKPKSPQGLIFFCVLGQQSYVLAPVHRLCPVLVRLMSHSMCHDNHLIAPKLFLVLGLESESAIISQTQRILHQRGTIMSDTQEETLPFHMHTTAPGGRIHQSFSISQLQDPDLQIHSETGLREVEGAALLHCSLNTALKLKSCRASGRH